MINFLIISLSVLICLNKINGQQITYDEFKKAVNTNPPEGKVRWPTPSVEKYNSFIQGLSSKGKINTKQEAAMALANFLQESGGLQFKRENKPKEYKEKNCDVAGQKYFGRGYIQLTWCSNYKAASKYLFNDERLVKNPDSVAQQESLSWDVSFWYWQSRVGNRSGVKQGQFGDTIKAINPGECKKGNKNAERRKNIYINVRKAFGLPGNGDLSGCN